MARFAPDKAALRPLGRFRGSRGQTVGLLGGSFNPAHAGHRHIAEEALRRLGVDWVWWLVSPQNPLKSTAEMAPLAARLASAARMADHPRMVATAVESDLGTVYSAETLRQLTRLFPHLRFVWLMGADNLGQISRWRAWQSLYARAAVAVFARAPYSGAALTGRAAQKFRAARLPDAASRTLARHRRPAWVFLRIRLHPASATAIRAAAQSGFVADNA
ncbi:putative nicotinate-nucleotide adenylyltransferase [Elstera cyanobacteriorum]|uniref:Probable nicotinate-nucleotide adenylyltransferase n=1 Tax=Elstera cyanobacteriorum TaxID=2022747 RepID=A0A255XI21_9PROT|nr:nicotinate-nucleotide adenylyltransferase [Elstera cyanobacteriorum]OYQ16619.1 nicotinic acid mononucleotide adenylyltransferase [Elstera cyanobacteriorum]GFZ87286.1 putative nicotinate-nucleotide adenylyltransferase [Elstera cyanobacteriorum]